MEPAIAVMKHWQNSRLKHQRDIDKVHQFPVFDETGELSPMALFQCGDVEKDRERTGEYGA
jgi:hypothetical protein